MRPERAELEELLSEVEGGFEDINYNIDRLVDVPDILNELSDQLELLKEKVEALRSKLEEGD